MFPPKEKRCWFISCQLKHTNPLNRKTWYLFTAGASLSLRVQLTEGAGESLPFVLAILAMQTMGNYNGKSWIKASAGLGEQWILDCLFLRGRTSVVGVGFPATSILWDGISARRIQNLGFRTLLCNFLWKNIEKSCSKGAPAVRRHFPFLYEYSECMFQCPPSSSQNFIKISVFRYLPLPLRKKPSSPACNWQKNLVPFKNVCTVEQIKHF